MIAIAVAAVGPRNRCASCPRRVRQYLRGARALAEILPWLLAPALRRSSSRVRRWPPPQIAVRHPCSPRIQRSIQPRHRMHLVVAHEREVAPAVASRLQREWRRAPRRRTPHSLRLAAPLHQLPERVVVRSLRTQALGLHGRRLRRSRGQYRRSGRRRHRLRWTANTAHGALPWTLLRSGRRSRSERTAPGQSKHASPQRPQQQRAHSRLKRYHHRQHRCRRPSRYRPPRCVTPHTRG